MSPSAAHRDPGRKRAQTGEGLPEGSGAVARLRRLLPWALLAVVLVVYLLTFRHGALSIDVATNDRAAWRIATSGTPWMEGFEQPVNGFWTQGAGGHQVAARTPGQILAAVPAYAVAHLLGQGFSNAPGGITAAVLTALAVAMMFAALRRLAGDWVALAATLIFAFATPVWSVAANALWTHPLTVFSVAGAAWAASRGRWWLAGTFLGVGLFARLHVALIAFVLGVGIGFSRRSLRPTLAVGVPAVAAMALLSVWNHFVFGTFDPRGAYTGHAYASLVPGGGDSRGYFAWNLFSFLFAWDRGWLLWSPILVVLLASVVRGWRSAPDWTRWLAIGGVSYALAQVGLNVYNGGDGFYGYRLALEPLTAVVPLYVATYSHAGALARRLVPWVSAAQFGTFFIYAFGPPLLVSVPADLSWAPNDVWMTITRASRLSAVLLVLGAVAWLAVWSSVARWARTRPDL